MNQTLPRESSSPRTEQREREARGGEGIYLFCLARPGATQACQGAALEEGQSLEAWSFRDLLCVQSQVPLSLWTGEGAEERLQDLHWLAPRACRHQAIIEQIMTSSPVLPTRFGTLFSSQEALRALLEEHYQQISDFLEQMEQREEWSLKGWLQRDRAVEGRFRAALQECTLPNSRGARYLVEKRLNAEAQRQLQHWLTQTEEQLHQQVLQITPDWFRRQIPPQTLSEEQEEQEEMVFHWALLLSPEQKEQLSLWLEETHAALASEGLEIEEKGPWPPYSFCPSLFAPA